MPWSANLLLPLRSRTSTTAQVYRLASRLYENSKTGTDVQVSRDLINLLINNNKFT